LVIVPVTVISSVVVAACPLPFDSGCANASGANNAQQMRMVIGFFILSLLLCWLYVSSFTLYKGIPERVLQEI
jgi:hypothetical protein